jgi:hypothetical protein
MNFNHDLGLIDTILTLDTTIAPPLGGLTNSLQILGTGALYLPIGTTAERPSNSAGMIRWNSDLGAVEVNNGTAWTSEGAGSVTSVAIASDTSALTVVSGSPITGAGTIHLTLSSELIGLAGLASTGIVTRTGLGTYNNVTITGTAGNITVSNGDGVSGAPTLNLATVTQGAAGTSFVKVALDGFGRVTNNLAVGASDITGALTYTPVNKAGDTMSGNLAMATYEVTGLPSTPTDPTAATSKAYVDALVSSGTVWKDPIVDPDIQDTVAATGFEAAAFAALTDGQSYTYIATAAFTFAGQGGGTSYAASIGDVVTLQKVGTVGNWSFVDALIAGNRFIIAGEDGTIGSTLYGVGFRKGDLIQYVSGAANLFASWTTPQDSGFQAIDFTSPKVSADVTTLVNTTVYDLNVSIAGTNHDITVTATAGYTFGALAADLTTALNAVYTGASCVLEPEGHFHVYSGDGTKVIVAEGTGANPLLAGLSTDFDIANIRSNILAGIIDGTTVLVNDADSKHYAHTYLYTHGINRWTEIAGPGAVGAGIGLSYSGTVLNVNLGAGITQLPTDEVGVDVYVGGGLMTTVDGTTSSTVAASQLSLTKVGTASTYTSVTTDAYGRVTAGSNPTPSLATNSDNVAITAVSANASYYPTFVSATTGYLPVDVGTGLTFNPSTNNLTTTTFTGALVGNASTATTAATATNITITTVATNATFYPVFVSAATGNLAPDVSTGLTFNPSTNTLTTTAISLSGQLTSTLAIGTAPFVITSTTQVSNLNVSLLEGKTWEAPGTIGSTTPNSGVFTDLITTATTTFTNGNFAALGDAKQGIYLLRNTTTNATQTELFLNGTSTQLVIQNNSVYTFIITIAGRRTDAVGGGAGYKFEGVVLKDTTSGSIALIGKPSKSILGETNPQWNATVAVDATTGALQVLVTGQAAKTIRWIATVQTTEVTN